MPLFFGTVFLGKVKSLNGQFIETKFILFFVPLFPIGSKLVLNSDSFKNRVSLDIPLNPTSVIAAYSRIFAFLLAALFLYIGIKSVSYPYIASGIVLFAAWIYFCYFFGRTTSNEANLRNRLGKSIGLYVLPEWLHSSYMNECYDKLIQEYNKLYQSNWKEDLLEEEVCLEKAPLLYGLALFNYMNYETPENEFYVNRAYHLLD